MLFGNLQRLYSSSNLLTGLNLLTLEGCSTRPSNPAGHARSRSWCESMNWSSVVREKLHTDIVHRYQILKTMAEEDKEDDESNELSSNNFEPLLVPIVGTLSDKLSVVQTCKSTPSRERRQQQPQQPPHLGKRKQQTVFVGNISFRVTQKELKDFFSKFGRVNKVCVVHDHIKKTSRGFAFITFAKEDAAVKAKMASPEELTLDNRAMRVLPAREKRMRLMKKNEEGDAESTDEFDYHDLKMEAAKDVNSTSILNDDSLILIFSYLGVEDLVEAGQVSKRWQRLASRCWASKNTLDFTNRFSIFGGRVLTIDVFQNIISQCINLRTLNASSVVPFLGYRAIELIVNLCPQLESLDVSGGELTDVGIRMIAEKLKNLKRVILKRCIHFGEKGLWWLLHLNQSLTLLDISGNLRINGKCFHHISPELRTIILDGCAKLAKYGFERIGQHCKLLTELSANGCASLTDEGLLDICTGCPDIRKLSLKGFFPNLSPVGIAYIQRLKQLVELHLFNNHALDDQSLNVIAVGCMHIQILDISACGSDVTDEGLTSLAACQELQQLHASYLELLTDSTLCALANVGKLEEVRFRGCMSVSVEGCQALLNLCPQLRILDLSGCGMVGSEILTSAVEAVQRRDNGPRLTLVVGGTGIDKAKMTTVGQHPLLTIDNLNYCISAYLDNPGYAYSEEESTESERTDDEDVDDFLVADDPQEEFDFVYKS